MKNEDFGIKSDFFSRSKIVSSNSIKGVVSLPVNKSSCLLSFGFFLAGFFSFLLLLRTQSDVKIYKQAGYNLQVLYILTKLMMMMMTNALFVCLLIII